MQLLTFDKLDPIAKEYAINNRVADMINYEHIDHYENWPEYKKAIDQSFNIPSKKEYVLANCKDAILEHLQDYLFTPKGTLISSVC